MTGKGIINYSKYCKLCFQSVYKNWIFLIWGFKKTGFSKKLGGNTPNCPGRQTSQVGMYVSQLFSKILLINNIIIDQGTPTTLNKLTEKNLDLHFSSVIVELRRKPFIQACVHTYTHARTRPRPHTCTYTHNHTQTHKYTHKYKKTHTYMHACTHACKRARTHTRVHACTYTQTHTSTHTHTVVNIRSTRGWSVV